ncbi:aminoacyl-tRNA hydrolase [Streptomyces kaempferi]
MGDTDVTTDPNAPWLIVGLGNPGPEYAMNRHNVGFMVADLLAERIGGSFKRAGKAQAQVIEGRIGPARTGEPPGDPGQADVVHEPVRRPRERAARLYKVPLAHVVAIHDELDIDYGVLRLKLGGGDNGHNGLKSMTKAMGPDYHRVRFGIGRPPGRMQVADFVLKDFASAERKELGYFVDRASDAVECLVIDGLERAQGTYNS